MSQAKNSDSMTPLVTPAGSAAGNPLKELGRRELLRGGGVAALAVAGAAIPFVAPAVAGGGELAWLIRLYLQQVDEFNATPHETDEESDAHEAATWRPTLVRLVETPVRNREDALAAIDWLFKESECFDITLSEPDHDYSKVLNAVRRYVAEEVRS